MKVPIPEYKYKRRVLMSATLLLVLFATTAKAFVPQPKEYPPRITIRTATIDVIPFFIRDENGTLSGGFVVDLLEELQRYALQDGVELDFTIDQGPELYNTALDYIATDCNTSANENLWEDCQRYDMIIGDYWPNPARFERVDFSPRWLETGLCTMKYVDKNKQGIDVTTLTEASRAGAGVCTLDGSILPALLTNSFPDVIQVLCPTNEACIEDLKAEKCSLFAQDYLVLLYTSRSDPSVEVTKELFQTQPIVWPIRKELDSTISYLLKRWLYRASYESTFDNLFAKYFSVQLCPIGTAGANCDKPCHPTHGTSGPNGECICESTKWRGEDCSIEVQEELNLIPKPLKIVGYTMFTINCVVVLLCFFWLRWYRRTPIIQVAQPFFLCLILVGCTISTSTILALSQEDSGDGPVPACMAAPWLYSVGFCVTFGTLYAKIRRVRILFESAAGMRRATVTTKETLIIVGSILSVDVAILMLWTILDPLEWRRTVQSTDKFDVSLESEGHCTSQHWKAWAGSIIALHGSLLLFASYSCYVSRNISTSFSEAKYLAIAMVSNLQIFLVGLPVLVIVGADPDTSYFVRCVVIWINDFMVVALIFGNFMYHTHVGRFRLRSTGSIINMTTREYAGQTARPSSVQLGSCSKQTQNSQQSRLRYSNTSSQPKGSTSSLEGEKVSDDAHPVSQPECNPDEELASNHDPPDEGNQDGVATSSVDGMESMISDEQGSSGSP